MLYKNILRPILFRLDPESAHKTAIKMMRFLGNQEFLRGRMDKLMFVYDQRLQRKVFGINFKNPVGLAAGFDKNGEAVRGLAALGFGFTTTGTITYNEQAGNDGYGPRVFRLPRDKALINRIGFENNGADKIALRLLARRNKWIPLGISIGKSRPVSLEDAHIDYISSLCRLYSLGDFFEINISSPNTPGLNRLQEELYLNDLLERLNEEMLRLSLKSGGGIKPILVKVSPDIERGNLNDLLDVCIRQRASGIIATNTSVCRRGLKTIINEEGGLSGRPLFERSLGIVKHIHEYTYGRLPIIASGGIFTAQNAYAMLKAGASLVQIFTSLVYEGPTIVRDINRGLLKIFEKEGIKNISEIHKKEFDNPKIISCYRASNHGCPKA